VAGKSDMYGHLPLGGSALARSLALSQSIIDNAELGRLQVNVFRVEERRPCDRAARAPQASGLRRNRKGIFILGSRGVVDLPSPE
jgi:hypothetical protein